MLFSGVPLDSVADVFVFIVICSVYVCSILWIYGDAATRGLAGVKGSLLPIFLIIVGLVASSVSMLVFAFWPATFVAWFFRRPPRESTAAT